MNGDIDQVIERLAGMVDQARSDRSRVGYFAAMYLQVTEAIKQAIDDDMFDDGLRMSELDLVFANRYIDAFDEYKAGGEPTAAWRVSFAAAERWRPIIVQQLLVAMNAHINLDLGIAAATVAPGDKFEDLRPDFNKIGGLLSSLTAGFVKDVEAVSPWIKLLDRLGGKAERLMINFSIDVARDAAWDLAKTLAPLAPADWPASIEARDVWTADFGRLILRPGPFLPLGLFVIRLRESNDVAEVIDHLAVSS